MSGKAANDVGFSHIDEKPVIVTFPDLDITFGELSEKIKMSGNSPDILKSAEKTLQKARGIWQPKAVYRWVKIKHLDKDSSAIRLESKNIRHDFDLGHSTRFLKNGEYGLISVYTAGKELEQQSMIASQKGDHLKGYFLDLSGLIVLNKVNKSIKEVAEKKAIEYGFGVSPFLSPGSVHGWNLSEQIKLSSFLPLDAIDVSIRDDAILSPFKSISSLIGIGKGYKSTQVGTTCQVCSKKDECQMNHNN